MRKRFPLGNPHLVGRFLAERGSFVGEVLDALDDVDAAFVKRFTRSADPLWAVFHTCCQQGILPPRRKPTRPASRTEGCEAARSDADQAEERRWQMLDADGKTAQLMRLWDQSCRLYLAELPDGDTRARITAALDLKLAEGATRADLEAWVLEDVRRRARSAPLSTGGSE